MEKWTRPVVFLALVAALPASGQVPFAPEAYLKASNTDLGDLFGGSVAVAGSTVVVGASWEDSNATGVNGNQADNSADSAGAAYVLVGSGASWSQEAYLKASNTEESDVFGYAVAASGDTVAVGAPNEDSGAVGVNGNQGDNGTVWAGAAYVFKRFGTSWGQQAYVKASNPGQGDYFGFSVAVDGDTLVVGAPGEASGASGVNGNQADDSAPWAGAAYVFVRSGSGWSQQAYLKASNTDAGDWFGIDVALSGDTLLVGAHRESSSATGVNGDQSDDSAANAGAAYVFVRSGTSWSQQAYLKASNTEERDFFACALDVSGDAAVVGAFYEDSSATGVDGDQADNSALNSGAAYVFARSGTSWSQQAYLKASNTDALDEFGIAAALREGTMVIGAWREASYAAGVNGNQDDNSAVHAGAAYVFQQSGTDWSQHAYLKASNTEPNEGFGNAVAASSGRVVVAALYEDSNATGVNGDESDNTAKAAGAAYAFAPVWVASYCTAGTSASGCQATLSVSGAVSATLPSGFDLTAAGVEGAKDGIFFFGSNGRQAAPWGNGTSYRCVVPPVVRTGLMSGVGSNGACDGFFSKDLNAHWCPACPKPAHNPGAGVLVQAQLWYRDPFSTDNQTTAFSDALEFFVAP